MTDQQEIQRQAALRLRDMASRFLGSTAKIDDLELRRKLTRWAFELAQEAVALEPIGALAEFSSLSQSRASNPIAGTAVPIPRRASFRPPPTRAVAKPQSVGPAVPGAVPILRASGVIASSKGSVRHIR
jgi:hypothetical protein